MTLYFIIGLIYIVIPIDMEQKTTNMHDTHTYKQIHAYKSIFEIEISTRNRQINGMVLYVLFTFSMFYHTTVRA